MDLTRRALSAGSLATLWAALFAGSGGFANAAQAAEADAILAHVDPELRAIARRMLAGGANPEFSETTLPQIRAAAAAAAAKRPPLDPAVPVVRRTVSWRAGASEIPVFMINARSERRRPAILYMHGGGFVGGDAMQRGPRLQALAAALDCTICSVEYQLAPEARFDVSLEQNYAALKWLHNEAEALGVDRRRIAVMGESAGGAHAAMVAFAARDRGEVPLVLQVLIYPALDDRTASTHQLPSFMGALVWGPASHRYAWRSFLGMEPGGPNTPLAAAPGRRTDLAGLAPAFIGVGGIDLLASENIDYSRRLLEAGVPTELVVTPGAFHGFETMAPDTSLARAFEAAKTSALRRAFSTVELA
jgi:acetyl esterase/lipase